MSRALKMALRFSFLMLAITLLAAIFAPSDETSSPYLSALSDLSVGSALGNHGGNHCKRTQCDDDGVTCISAIAQECKGAPGGGCRTILCNE